MVTGKKINPAVDSTDNPRTGEEERVAGATWELDDTLGFPAIDEGGDATLVHAETTTREGGAVLEIDDTLTFPTTTVSGEETTENFGPGAISVPGPGSEPLRDEEAAAITEQNEGSTGENVLERAISAFTIQRDESASAGRRREDTALVRQNPAERVYDGVSIPGTSIIGAAEDRELGKKRRRRMMTAGAGIILAAVAAGVVAAVVKSSDKQSSPLTMDSSPPPGNNPEITFTSIDGDFSERPSPAPSLPPSRSDSPTFQRFDRIKSTLLSQMADLAPTSRAALNDTESPQGKALEWLAHEDERQVDPTEDPLSLVQRYALAQLYFATGGPTHWRDKMNFLNESHECDWNVPSDRRSFDAGGVRGRDFYTFSSVGVQCGGDNGIEVFIMFDNDAGRMLPEELSLLSNLRQLYISRNFFFFSTIPSVLFHMPKLEILFLNENSLAGPVPELQPNSKTGSTLRQIHLGRNNILSTIPPSISLLSSLTLLDLSGCLLTGSIPRELSNLTLLEHLFLDVNELSGSVMSDLGRLTSLETLYLDFNDFTSSLPSELGLMTSLKKLHIQGSKLSGRIPSSLGKLTTLENLNLYSSQLTGPIPAELGHMEQLTNLYLQMNALTSTIPSALGMLTSLTTNLDLGGNALTGLVPRELGNLTNLDHMSFQGNSITGTMPEEVCHLVNVSLFGLVVDCNEVECSCCTRCCEDGECPFQ